MPPMLEKSRGFRCDLPLARVREIPPSVHVAADLIDNRCRVILLFFCRAPTAFVEDEFFLGALFLFLVLLRLRNWGDEFCASAAIDDPLSRLAALIEFPMLSWILVGRIENRPIKERIRHSSPHRDCCSDSYCGLKSAFTSSVLQPPDEIDAKNEVISIWRTAR